MAGRFIGRARQDRASAAGFTIIAAFVVITVAAPLLAPYSAVQQSCAVFAHPSTHHWLGCDDGGVDILSQLLYGGRISIAVGAAASLVAMAIGGGVGILAGFFGGAIDVILMRITDYFIVIPALVLMVVVADVWGPNLVHVILVIGLLLWTNTARVLRAEVRSVRERVYVKRARSVGASSWRLLSRHVFPNVAALLIANTVLTVGVAVFYETALAFLGLSDPTQVTWGKMIEFGFLQDATVVGAWWAIVPPGLCITVLVFACFLCGRGIETSLTPSTRPPYISPRTWKWRSRMDFDGDQ